MKKFDTETERVFGEYGQACYEVGHGQGRGLEAKTDEQVRDEWEEILRARLDAISLTPEQAKRLDQLIFKSQPYADFDLNDRVLLDKLRTRSLEHE